MRKMKRRQPYSSLERCIYCGDDSSPISLTEEHIIPLALGGRLEFERASCGDCQSKIGKFEGRLINGLFASPRAILGIEGRAKPREKIKLARFTDETGIHAVATYTAKASHPGMLALETLSTPRFPANAPPISGPRPIGLVLKNIKEWSAGEHIELINLHGSYLDFTRFLAKIAHSYWMAERGMDKFFPVLTNFIRGTSEAEHDYFIGSNDFNSHVDDLHHVSLGEFQKDEFEYGYVDISLFSHIPEYNGYRVYVGSIGKEMRFQFL